MIRDKDWLLWPQLFNDGECDAIIAMGVKLRGMPGDMTNVGERQFPEVRSSVLRWVHMTSRPEFLWVFGLLNAACDMADKHFGARSDTVDALQFTEYQADRRGQYDWHKDSFDEPRDRVLSICVQLSEPSYAGGRLELRCNNPPPRGLMDRRGAAVAFRGNLYHRVTPIIVGTRYSLVAWRLGETAAMKAAEEKAA